MPEPAHRPMSASAAGERLPALRLDPHISAAEALAVFRRKLPGADASVEAVTHPFWWAVLGVATRGIIGRRRAGPPPRRSINVLVNAASGKGFIADFDPRGQPVSDDDRDCPGAADPAVSAAEASRIAHSLVRTKVVKTVKLGMRIGIDESAPPRGVLKPNWLVTGENERHRATFLVDALDASHYIVRVEKL